MIVGFSPLLVAAVLMVGALLGGGIDPTVLAVSLAAPVICLQDLIRYGALSSDAPWIALVSDFVWLLLIAGILLVPNQLSYLAPPLWLGAAIVSTIIGVVAFKLRLAWRQGRALLNSWHPTSVSMAWGTFLALGTNLFVVSAAGSVLGLGAAGALRGASTLFGPINVLFAFVNIGVTASLARTGPEQHLKRGLVVSGLLIAAAAGWAAVLLLLPFQWGELLLGDIWSGTRALISFTLVEYLFLAAAAGAALILRVRRRARALAVQKTVVALVIIMLVVLVFAADGTVQLVALALATAAMVGAVIAWTSALTSASGK